MNLLISSILTALVSGAAIASPLTIYTDRPTDRLQPIADQFTRQTGVPVVIVEKAYPALLSQLEAEGDKSPADLLFTKDLVFQTELAKKGMYQPMDTKSFEVKVSQTMRDPANLWTAVTFRARTLVYNPAVTDVSQLKTYEDLTSDDWAGRLCVRTSNHGYNEAMVASWIVTRGYEGAKKLVSGLVANLATDVFKGDTTILEAIANGTCEVGLVNHYYLATMLANKPSFPVKAKFLDQGYGVHVNGTGVGIAKTSQNAVLAQQFIELLMTDKVQVYLADAHFDYPASVNAAPQSLIKDWDLFSYDPSNWSVIGNEVEAARKLVKEVGYN